MAEILTGRSSEMMKKFKQNVQGIISIFLVLVLVPMMALSALVVDTSRINMARSMVSSAGDLTMNTALANYDTILKDVYGLFAMAQENDYDDEALSNELRNYFARTLVSYGVVSEGESGAYVDSLIGDFRELINGTREFSAGNFMDMTVEDFNLYREEQSSLANANILRSQIVDYTKYRGPLTFGMGFLDSVKAFKNVQKQTEVVEKQLEAQEYTQTVTKSCTSSIQAIRGYDKLIKILIDPKSETTKDESSGVERVTGMQSASDGVLVPIGDYYEQVNKYTSAWGANNNYSSINRLNLVFQGNPPALDHFYLTGLHHTANEFFVNSDTNAPSLHYDNSGISLDITSASSVDQAQSLYDTQVQTLKNNTSAQKMRQKYSSLKLPYSTDLEINADGHHFIGFKNEESAIDHFIDFEQFLTNDAATDLSYDNVKSALEDLYRVGKYYDQYNSELNTAVTAAENRKNQAESAVSTAETNASNAESSVRSNLNSINSANDTMWALLEPDTNGDYAFLSGIQNTDHEDLLEELRELASQTHFSMPSTVTVEGHTFYNLTNYADRFMEVQQPRDNNYQYAKLFREIVSSGLAQNRTYQELCTKANRFLNSNTSQSFAAYMGSRYTNDPLFTVLNYLWQNNQRVLTIKQKDQEHTNIRAGYSSLKTEARNAKNAYDTLVSRRNSARSDYASLLADYSGCVANYQQDMYYYAGYMEAAAKQIGERASAVKKQFNTIQNNVLVMKTQLENIDALLTALRASIETYDGKLDQWESATNSYAGQNGSDNFSAQSSSDVESARSQYDLRSLDTLILYVTNRLGEYTHFYEYLTDGSHFKYGSANIGTLDSAEAVKNASSEVNSQLPTVVTKQEASNRFPSLYNTNPESDLVDIKDENDQWYFLTPMLPSAFLAYLDTTFPDKAPETVGIISSGNTPDSRPPEDVKNDYEKMKKDAKNGSKTQDDNTPAGNSYGYNYMSHSLKDSRPSKNSGSKAPVDTKENKIEEKDGDMDVSSGFKEQNSKLSSVLSGIGSVMEAGAEKMLIMDYVEENFSYNTIVQDQIAEVRKKDPNFVLASLVTPNFTEDEIAAAKEKAKTLSNYHLNEFNNYLYGGELEYITFGNGNPAKNVSSVKASIYAIRFAFNAIFAFTDTEIKSTTLAAGAAVQAATLGIVPCQLVQIVLQLALAGAESAMDLKLMGNGADVAIVKSKDSWICSVSGATRMAGEMLAFEAKNATKSGIRNLANGFQKLADAAADSLGGAVDGILIDIDVALKTQCNQIVDMIFADVEAELEAALNTLLYEDPSETKRTPEERVTALFLEVEDTVVNNMRNKLNGSPLGEILATSLEGSIRKVVSDARKEVLKKIRDAGIADDVSKSADSNLSATISEHLSDLKLGISQNIYQMLSAMSEPIANAVKSVSADFKGKLNDISAQIGEKGEELSEEAAEKVKQQVSDLTNKFVDQYLESDNSTIGSGSISGSSTSSTGAAIAFGYKEYLMLFLLLDVLVNDDAVLLRTADLIECNLQNAQAGKASFSHKRGANFSMSDARTYVSAKAGVKLDMLFLNMDFFARIFTGGDEEDQTDTEVTGDFAPAATIQYRSLYGY